MGKSVSKYKANLKRAYLKGRESPHSLLNMQSHLLQSVLDLGSQGQSNMRHLKVNCCVSGKLQSLLTFLNNYRRLLLFTSLAPVLNVALTTVLTFTRHLLIITNRNDGQSSNIPKLLFKVCFLLSFNCTKPLQLFPVCTVIRQVVFYITQGLGQVRRGACHYFSPLRPQLATPLFRCM